MNSSREIIKRIAQFKLTNFLFDNFVIIILFFENKMLKKKALN